MDTKQILDKIRMRPGLYLSTLSVYSLKAFLDGYRIGNREESEDQLMDQFQVFILKKYRINKPVSWDNIIRLHCTSDKQAFDLFFDLFDEFNDTHS